jgi:serine/threonine protein kinase
LAKCRTVFLGSGNNTVKLGDFGLSKLMHVGTPFYMSPEICARERYTLQSDIWGVGCVMYELCQKQPPFNAHAKTPVRLGKFPPLPDIKNVIASCLQVNPDRRPETAALEIEVRTRVAAELEKEKFEIETYHNNPGRERQKSRVCHRLPDHRSVRCRYIALSSR